MKDKEEIIEWINKQTNPETLFLSVHFDTPPTTKQELCVRCRPIFQQLFKSLIGRRWIKHYGKHFTLLGFQEYGKYGNMHAHFLLVCRKDFDAITVLNHLIDISDRIRMDVWQSEEDKRTRPKQYGNDIVIKQTFSNDVITYTTKEIRIINQRINDTMILDVDIFNNITRGENNMSNPNPNTSGLKPFNQRSDEENREIRSAGGQARAEKARKLKTMREIINGLREASDKDPLEMAISSLYFDMNNPTQPVGTRLRILTTFDKLCGGAKPTKEQDPDAGQ